MITEPRQLIFDLPNRPALGSEDFLVGRSNRAAVDLIDSWSAWTNRAAVIAGPEGCGKTHLANVWRLKTDAVIIAAQNIDIEAARQVKTHTAIVVEDLDRGIADQTALFHMLNMVREAKAHLLLTSRVLPGELVVTLPDLRSRLRALPVVAIDPPDGDFLSGVFVKLFADRQLSVEPDVIAYLVVRMERSMKSANRLVDLIDRRALAMQRSVTKLLAQSALAEVDAGGAEDTASAAGEE